MARTETLGLDIGGANLKAAHTNGTARSLPFALWKHPRGLPGALRDLSRSFDGYDQLAVTMTGELCDCFATKREGVYAILDAVDEAAGRKPVRIWQTDGDFADLAVARESPLRAAAANWLALATFAGRFAPAGSAVLLDIGSTTTDLVPLRDGQPVPRGMDDFTRLRCREMLYTGTRRTPLCALLAGEGAAEWFATTHDVYLVLGDTPEDAGDHDTADGRPATRTAAHARLARMVCADTETMPEASRMQLAADLRARQLRLLREALTTVTAALPEPLTTVVLSGSGEFLARKVVEATVPSVPWVSLSERLGEEVSRAACAHAVAMLAAERPAGPAEGQAVFR